MVSHIDISVYNYKVMFHTIMKCKDIQNMPLHILCD